MMMNTKKMPAAIALLSLLALSGCGSDSDSSSDPQRPIADTDKVHESLEVAVTPKSELEGTINVYLGHWYPCSDLHPEMCTQDADLNDLPAIGVHGDENDPNRLTYGRGNSNGTYNKEHNRLTARPAAGADDYSMKISAAELKRFAAESVRSDLFIPGHYSALDVVLYVSSIRDDFEVTLGEFNEEMNTYEFTTSFDANNDGDYDDEGDYKDSKNWYASMLYSGGDAKKSNGQPTLEPFYDRMDELWVKEGMHIRFQPESSIMTARRQQTLRAEVARFHAAGDKVVLPELRVDFGDGRGPQVVAQNVEVKPHNLRPDVFQKGVITVLDVALTAHDEYGVKFGVTFWPTIATNADVGSYAVTAIDEQRAHGFYGWTLYRGEDFTSNDFFYHPNKEWPVAKDVQTDAEFGRVCEFLRDDDGNLNQAAAQECIDNWFNLFGGKNTHRMADTVPMVMPQQYVMFEWFANMENAWEMAHRNYGPDGQFPIYDIERAVAPLDENHFGWKVADCAQCHSLDNIHLNGDSPTLPEQSEPYYCASCHGSNGAPVGHGEEARCFWCHSEDKLMPNHGEASQKMYFDDTECSGVTKQKKIDIGGYYGPCADAVKTASPDFHREVKDFADNSTFYRLLPAEKRITYGNNDWRTSESFPDPYSCMTCHPNQ
ncbi:hypothetical protein [Ferrimonas sp. SCSIO 43195]|uniref:hypothetical protein n=1 Tax=Ferrimonas sp. SCSIO 43195 TaxID=2822844 RepID=UPI0020761233|nr:hypothetical protein [Ferrimonas sp. SCSIO 43195]USD37312.1 hypothetical protein J8Z22_20390 [Ferrimonas sp. SCSIO 43195]